MSRDDSSDEDGLKHREFQGLPGLLAVFNNLANQNYGGVFQPLFVSPELAHKHDHSLVEYLTTVQSNMQAQSKASEDADDASPIRQRNDKLVQKLVRDFEDKLKDIKGQIAKLLNQAPSKVSEVVMKINDKQLNQLLSALKILENQLKEA